MLRHLLRRRSAPPSAARRAVAPSLREEFEVLASSAIIRDLGFARSGERGIET